MNKERKNESSEQSDDLANRLGRRFKKKKESGEEVSRLGERLVDREDKAPEGSLEAPDISAEDLESEAKDFFNEIVGMSENHPELENVKISELKKILAEIGMEHPEEVIKKLKKENKSMERREVKKKYTTY